MGRQVRGKQRVEAKVQIKERRNNSGREEEVNNASLGVRTVAQLHTVDLLSGVLLNMNKTQLSHKAPEHTGTCSFLFSLREEGGTNSNE